MPVYEAPLGFGDGEERKIIPELGYAMKHGLGIEFKTKKGSQSQTQKDFQNIFEAAGYSYSVVRSFEQFKYLICTWIAWALPDDRRKISAAHVEITKAAEQREKEKFYKIIGKK